MTSLEECLTLYWETMATFTMQFSSREKQRGRVEAILKGVESFSDMIGDGLGSVSSLPYQLLDVVLRLLLRLDLSTGESHIHCYWIDGEGRCDSTSLD